MIDAKNKLTAEEASAVDKLTENQLEYAYRKQLLQYRMADAKRHAEILLEDKPDIMAELDDGDFATMAEHFEEGYDCNIAENAQWAELVWEYLCEHFGADRD